MVERDHQMALAGAHAGGEVVFDLDAAAFSNDAFRILEFKVKRCPRARPHGGADRSPCFTAFLILCSPRRLDTVPVCTPWREGGRRAPDLD